MNVQNRYQVASQKIPLEVNSYCNKSITSCNRYESPSVNKTTHNSDRMPPSESTAKPLQPERPKLMTLRKID